MKLKNLMGEVWFSKLKIFFASPYFNTLQTKLQEEIGKDKTTVVPLLDYMFRPFKLCPYDKLKVVIINDKPLESTKANDGLSFSIQSDFLSDVPSEARAFEEGIEEEMYNGLRIEKNYNLERLASQGVLLINTAMSMSFTEGKFIPHTDLWKPFIKYLLMHISKYNSGKVFIFLGKDVRKHVKIILPTANYILTTTHPRDATHFAQTWDSGGIFDVTNQILKQNNKEEIIW